MVAGVAAAEIEDAVLPDEAVGDAGELGVAGLVDHLQQRSAVRVHTALHVDVAGEDVQQCCRPRLREVGGRGVREHRLDAVVDVLARVVHVAGRLGRDGVSGLVGDDLGIVQHLPHVGAVELEVELACALVEVVRPVVGVAGEDR